MRREWLCLIGIVLVLGVGACDSSSDSGTEDGEQEEDTNNGDSGDDTGDTNNGQVADCSSASGEMEEIVCAAQALMETLSEEERDTLVLDFSDKAARTTWSNLPGVERNGLQLGDLSQESHAAVLQFASVVLSEEGYQDFVGGLAADDYLATLGGGAGPGGGGPGGGGGGYGSEYYSIAFIGEPSTTGDWMIQIGGHHMAFNITYVGGQGYPVPYHQGMEPKASFTINAESFAPMASEGAALVALFDSFSQDELAASYLSGQSFADVLIGPDNGSGVLPSDYPSQSNRAGVLVTDLSQEQRALVIAVLQEWLGDYHGEIADTLLAEYSSEEVLADTYVAWAGSESGPDVDVSGTYFRIDGPRVWLEVACQNGVLISDQTHYHSVFRDKLMDYGGNL